MLNRIFIKDFLSIKNITLDIDSNFVVFSGPSGAGKSIFMNALLSCFSLSSSEASLVDIEIEANLDFDKFGIEKEEIYNFQRVKNKSARYFINNQSVSKKAIQEMSSKFINYLSVNDDKEFSSDSLLNILDTLVATKDKDFYKTLQKLSDTFKRYTKFKSELNELKNSEANQNELQEFLKFEINKISTLNPKVNELEELLILKQNISKKDKILEAVENANSIFDYEDKVYKALSILDINLPNFDDAMTEVRDVFENATSSFEDLNDDDIENILDRVEKLNELKHKHGSIELALEYKKTKENELEKLENISWEKDVLVKKLQQEENNLETISRDISGKRALQVSTLEQLINNYLEKMYLKDITLNLNKINYSEIGVDEVEIKLNNTNIKKLSTGELNRVKLAFLAAKNSVLMRKSDSILFLDEVDSNLSGKESMSVAKVLKELSQNYQIFAISHQPQLSSLATAHYLVDKNENLTSIKKLQNEERIDEVARMVSGEDITKEAKELAKTLING